jgi:hypothetical protein
MVQLKMSCIDIERAKHLVFVYVVLPLMNYMSTKFKGAHNIFEIFTSCDKVATLSQPGLGTTNLLLLLLLLLLPVSEF